MLQACAQAVDFKVGHHFGEGQRDNPGKNPQWFLGEFGSPGEPDF
jgi:hypothetical protein